MRGRSGKVPAAAAEPGQHFLAVSALSALCLLRAFHPACSQEAGPSAQKYGWREVWTGADAMRDVWLLYSGVTLAPWSEHIHDPGWRLRAQTGYGHYKYELQEDGERRKYDGAIAYGDVLAGYHWQEGPFTAKLYAGVSYIDHMVRPGASKGRLVGPQWGAKVAAELWLDLGEAQWTSLNINFTTAHNTASARWRYGLKVIEGLSVGPELRVDTNAGLFESYGDMFREYEGRAGLFAAYAWDGYELTLAGGVAAYMKGTQGEEVTPYGTVNFLVQF